MDVSLVSFFYRFVLIFCRAATKDDHVYYYFLFCKKLWASLMRHLFCSFKIYTS